MVWLIVRVLHYHWKVVILVTPCFCDISIISTTENAVMLVAFPNQRNWKNAKKPGEVLVFPQKKSERMK